MLAAPMSSPAPALQASYRLLVGLALSALAHFLLIAGVRPMVAAYAPARPIEVQIRHVAPEPDALFAIPAESGVPAPAAAAPAPAETRTIEPPRPGAAPVPVTGPDLKFNPDQYYTSRELDVRAEPLNDVPLVYPQLAYQRRIKGKVTLQIFINERGGIDQLLVLDAEPHGVFEGAALAATEALQFSAAMKNGRRVKSQKIIEVAFDPYESIHIP
jgi:TonB family protein